MRGSVFKRGSIYAVRYDTLKGESEKRIQKYKGGFKTKKAAQEYLNKVLNDISEGTYVKTNKIQCGSYIEDWFNKSYKNSVPRPQQNLVGFLLRNIL